MTGTRQRESQPRLGWVKPMSKVRDNIDFYHEFVGVPEPMEAEDIRSSFLATTVHLQEAPELLSRDHDAAQAVSDGLRAKAANTRRVYQTAWHLLCE